MEVVVSNEDHFAVLEKVLKALDASKHVRPKVYLDKELDCGYWGPAGEAAMREKMK